MDAGPLWDAASLCIQQLPCNVVLCLGAGVVWVMSVLAGGPALDWVSALLCQAPCCPGVTCFTRVHTRSESSGVLGRPTGGMTTKGAEQEP